MERNREAHLNYYASAYNRGKLSHCKTKLNQILQKQAYKNKHASLTKIRITQNQHIQKTKARLSHLLWHPAWKRSGTILVEWEGLKARK